VHGISSMANMAKVGRVALKALIYFEVLTTIALVIGLVAVNLFRPGVHQMVLTLERAGFSRGSLAASKASCNGKGAAHMPETESLTTIASAVSDYSAAPAIQQT
jgi:Na+/H+-dicarboxylate symporter